MSVYAVIAEFNPFHNGHKLFCDLIRENDPGAAIIAVMSGSFVERGDVAIVDKYCRAEMALRCGCNLVLELPAPWCFSGAEFFARGGVYIADSIGISDFLAFGSESGNIDALKLSVERMSKEKFITSLSDMRDKHPNLNTAELRRQAYTEIYGDTELFSGSNNLLALEYLSAINELSASIVPITVKRAGCDYNSEKLSKISSATAIRNAVRERLDLSRHMPKAALELFSKELNEGREYRLSRLDTAATSRLRSISREELSRIMEISGGMENRLIKAAQDHRTIEGIIDAAKQRRYSESRLRRAIISAIIGTKTSDAETLPAFTVLLGADRVGRGLLSAARKKSKIAVISKPSDEKKLSGEAENQYLLHKRAERISELCCEGEPRKISAIMV